MRPGEFWEAMNAYRTEKEADRQHVGELARGAALRLFNLQLKKESRIRDPRKFWLMPWDDTADDETEEVLRLTNLSREERESEIDDFYRRIRQDRHGKQ